MATNAQFMVSVPEVTRDKMDGLRIVLGISRAEVGRMALEGRGLGQLERANGERLQRLDALAATLRYPNTNELVRALVKEYGQKMPTLEQLEDPERRMVPARIPRQAGPTEAERAPDEAAAPEGTPLFSG